MDELTCPPDCPGDGYAYECGGTCRQPAAEHSPGLDKREHLRNKAGMVRIRYIDLTATDLDRLAPVVPLLAAWRTRVKPFGPQYLAVLKAIDALNELAAAAGAQPPFPPTPPPTAY